MVRTKDIEEEIESYLQALLAEGYQINKAILFGSMVNGTPHDYSDIDLAVWSDEFDENYFTTVEKTAHLKRTHKKIELHPFRSTDNSDTNPFIEEIENTGKLVFHSNLALFFLLPKNNHYNTDCFIRLSLS